MKILSCNVNILIKVYRKYTLKKKSRKGSVEGLVQTLIFVKVHCQATTADIAGNKENRLRATQGVGWTLFSVDDKMKDLQCKINLPKLCPQLMTRWKNRNVKLICMFLFLPFLCQTVHAHLFCGTHSADALICIFFLVWRFLHGHVSNVHFFYYYNRAHIFPVLHLQSFGDFYKSSLFLRLWTLPIINVCKFLLFFEFVTSASRSTCSLLIEELLS